MLASVVRLSVSCVKLPVLISGSSFRFQSVRTYTCSYFWVQAFGLRLLVRIRLFVSVAVLEDVLGWLGGVGRRWGWSGLSYVR